MNGGESATARSDRRRRSPSAAGEAAAVLARDGGQRPLDASEVVPATRAGAVVLVPRALQRAGFFDVLIEATFAAIGEACGAARADECRRLGLERMHEVLDLDGIEAAVQAIDRRLAIPSPRLMKTLAHGVLGVQGSFYVYANSRVRFMVPQEIVRPNRARFHSRANRLQLGDYAPHRDFWEGVPINAINLWMALGPVERDNGMLIYPDVWGKEVMHEGISPPKDQDFGAPLALALEPGDVVVFDGRQLHATAVNLTSATRAVLTGRFCPELPVAPTAEMLERASYWSPLIGTRFERFAGAATKMSWVYAVERLKRRANRAVGALERRLGDEPLRALRQALRYRRADRLFDA